MRYALLALTLLLPTISHAQQPAPLPDYKALYEQANDAAAKWKEAALAHEQEVKEMQHRLDVYQANYFQVSLENRAAEHGRLTQAGVGMRQIIENEQQSSVTKRFVLAPNHHVHLIEYGGPNEFMTFLGVDPLQVHLRIGIGGGKPVDTPINRSFQGTSGNKTWVYGDGVGCKVFYVDDIHTPAGCGTFEAVFQKDALYRPQAEKAAKSQTNGVGSISHYSGQ